MIYWVHRLCALLVPLLPPGPLQVVVEELAPYVAWLWPGQRLRAERNIERVLGPQATPALVRQTVHDVFRGYARYLLELIRLPSIDVGSYGQEAVIHGKEYLDRALQSGRGVILASGHIGNWDMAGAWLAAQGFRVNVPVETLRPLRWNEQVQQLRRAAGLNAIPIESGARRMWRALARGEILGLLVDRPLTERGVPVEFFGAVTQIPGGAARLALRTGSLLLVGAAVREASRPVIYISPPIDTRSSGDEARDVQVIMQRVMSRLEQIIRRHPDQWYMFRDMWPAPQPMLAASPAPKPAL